jgi:hypothetical protein
LLAVRIHVPTSSFCKVTVEAGLDSRITPETRLLPVFDPRNTNAVLVPEAFSISPLNVKVAVVVEESFWKV